MEKPHISIVSPVYRAELMLDNLVLEIKKALHEIGKSYEIILVDDRSPDGSWKKMQEIASTDENVKVYRLSRNFGQHPTIIAGLSKAQGDWIVVMDCDLQDQPKEIIKLYNETHQGFDVVMASRNNRKDSFFKKLTSKLFSKVFNYLSDIKMNHEVANFGIYNRKVVDEVLNMGDYIKSFPLFVYFVGFNSNIIEVEHAERDSGKSNYTFGKLVSLAFNAIVSYSNKPLKIFVKFGMIISLISILVGIFNIILYFEGNIKVSGYSSIIISIWLLSGIIITVIGVVGIYIGKVFEQSKGRPPYIFDR